MSQSQITKNSAYDYLDWLLVLESISVLFVCNVYKLDGVYSDPLIEIVVYT